MFNSDLSSMLLLLVGKESHWTPYIMILILIIHKWTTIEQKFNQLLLFNKVQYELSGKIHTNLLDAYTYGELSTSMWAILLEIQKTIKTKGIRIKKAKTIQFPANQAFDDDGYISIPSDNQKIQITNTIYCVIEMKTKDLQYNSDRSSNDKKDASIETINMSILLTSSVSITDIIEYVNKVTELYNKHIKAKNENQLYIIKPTYTSKMNSDGHFNNGEIQYPCIIPFKSKKSFDNLFFEGKEALLDRLNSFVRRDKYAMLGLPETLGLLFYGEPGTGKTSAIKAIANYLQMHLVIVPMTHIKKKSRLEELFFSHKMDDYPQEKRIYVFEEIDCNGWEGIVTDRKLLKECSVATVNDKVGDAITSAVSAIADSIKNGVNSDNIKAKKEDNDKLTLGAVLEVIDGLIEAPGRIIIFTTNHKEHLDPALLRPGRIDMQVEFKKLRRGHIADIYKKWYGYPIYERVLNDIPDYKFTQAEISQMLFKYENASSQFIEEITKSNK